MSVAWRNQAALHAVLEITEQMQKAGRSGCGRRFLFASRLKLELKLI
jgi:hypothetical protein